MSAVAARTLLAAAVVGALVLAVPGPAAACSCGPGDPARMLAEADAAFVGALTGPPVDTGNYEGDWPFAVEQWIVGGGEPEVDVRSPLGGEACGFEIGRGTRVGVLLYERDGLLTGGLCTTIDADVLVAAAAPAGPLDGEGPIALLVGGIIGPHRLVALDAQGRELARAPGDEPVYQLAVCPGSGYVAELVGDATLAVRDLASFEVAWQRALPGSDRWYYAVDCRADDGGEVLVLGADQTGFGVDGVVLRATPNGVEVVAEGLWHDGRFATDAAVVITGTERTGVALLDLATGELTTLFTLDVAEGFGDVGHLVMSPDRTRVAFRAATYRQDTGTATLHVADLVTGEIASHPGAGAALWLDDDTLLDDTRSELKVSYTVAGGEIRQVGTYRWDFTPRAAAGTTVYGTRWISGVIRAAERDGGEATTLRVLPSNAVYALAAPVGAPAPQPVESLEGDVGDAEPEPPTSTTSTWAPTTTTGSPPPVTTTSAPPLAAPGGDGGGGPSLPLLAALGGAAAAGGLAWAWRRRSTTG